MLCQAGKILVQCSGKSETIAKFDELWSVNIALDDVLCLRFLTRKLI